MTMRPLTHAIALTILVTSPTTSALDTFSTGVNINDGGDTTSADLFVTDVSVLDGKTCIGNGCTDGETFDNETTLKLRSSLPNIEFLDTSGTSFPDRDWKLLVNDGGSIASGGLERFSIEDLTAGTIPFTVEGGASSNTLWIDTSGRVGINTNSPLVNLHMLSGNTPAIRLEQDGSSGFTPQTWDVSGNESYFFIRDTTHGSKLPFRIYADSSTNAIIVRDDNIGFGTTGPAAKFHIENTSSDDVDDFVVDADGNIGTGTTSPEASLHINRSNGTAGLLVEETSTTVAERALLRLTNNGGGRIDWTNTALGKTWKMNTNGANQFIVSELGVTNPGKFILENNGGNLEVGLGRTPAHPLHHSSGAHLTAGGVWTNASSRSLKKEIRELDADEALAAIDALKPVTYRYKRDDGERYVGFIAEDVPELVAQSDRESLSPMDMVALLTKVVQEQGKSIRELHQRLEDIQQSRE